MRRIRWLPLLSVIAVVAAVVTGIILSPGTVGIVLAIAGLTLAVLTDKEGSPSPASNPPRRSFTTAGSVEPTTRSPERSP